MISSDGRNLKLEIAAVYNDLRFLTVFGLTGRRAALRSE